MSPQKPEARPGTPASPTAGKVTPPSSTAGKLTPRPTTAGRVSKSPATTTKPVTTRARTATSRAKAATTRLTGREKKGTGTDKAAASVSQEQTLATSAQRVVREGASILEEEVAAGIGAAKRVEETLSGAAELGGRGVPQSTTTASTKAATSPPGSSRTCSWTSFAPASERCASNGAGTQTHRRALALPT